MQLSETDTRQGLINPLFRALQWDFGDFESIRSELRVPQFNEPVDYAFYSSKTKTDTPILLLEAKRLGSDLAHKNHVKQLTSYLGATGVQWGVLSDGNRYVLYNSLGGTSFDSSYPSARQANAARVPTSTRAAIRTCGKAARPRDAPGTPNACRFVASSGTFSVDPSNATRRRPR